jgi:YegS/Rv2252/BmrU family lipid kinase
MSTTKQHRKFIYLVNPISGTRNKKQVEERFLQQAAARGFEAVVLPTVASGDYEFVAQKIREEGFTDVVICGGDGTVNQVINSLRDQPVHFGIIPMGSGNGLANAAKIPKQSEKAIDLIFSGKARYIDAFMVNEQFACMLCGIGFDAKVAHDFAEQPGRGLITYIQQTLKNFITANPYPFEIVVNDQVIQTSAFFISIANSNQFGNEFTIAPKASLNDGLLDIVIVPKMSKAILPFAVMAQVRKGKLVPAGEVKGTTIQYFQTPKIHIKNKGTAPLHIDGEPKETAAVFNISILPRCFQLIQPVS